MYFQRHLSEVLLHFKDKILFISGPRQSGKTSLIRHDLLPDLELNMDIAQDRIIFKKFPETLLNWYDENYTEKHSKSKKPLVFIDEIHKVKNWRNILKGCFDKTSQKLRFVASGSSAFHLRKQDQGDSLAGRAIWLNLFPLSFREYIRNRAPEINLEKAWKGKSPLLEAIKSYFPHQKKLRKLWEEYSQFGSFPENLDNRDPIFLKQWLIDYQSALLDRDLKDLHVGKDVERVWNVYELLLESIGSTYSLRSISETLNISPNTAQKDLLALKQVLWGFEIPVCVLSKAKQIRKEKKFYPIDFCFNDYSSEKNSGSRFENQVACLLYRGLYSEIGGRLAPLQLGFYRDYQKREVDFVIRDKSNIFSALECKMKQKHASDAYPALQTVNAKENLVILEEEGIFEKNREMWSVSIELFAPCLE
ncbi:MAG: ATP-binding protein [Deltaproteobacteria bacterium]|nr:ATP-binding protein [Deltaproteobacteria bacterium]